MEEIVWSNGEKYQKSNKDQKPILNSNNEIIHNIASRGEYALKNELKREEIMERCMSVQTFQNPFLSKDFNDVLLDQETYLKPLNSNYIKEY